MRYFHKYAVFDLADQQAVEKIFSAACLHRHGGEYRSFHIHAGYKKKPVPAIFRQNRLVRPENCQLT